MLKNPKILHTVLPYGHVPSSSAVSIMLLTGNMALWRLLYRNLYSILITECHSLKTVSSSHLDKTTIMISMLVAGGLCTCILTTIAVGKDNELALRCVGNCVPNATH
ncbi:hypothetical protein BDD12DRAFT_312979 [Trichophaea hybrida]|nr:hypothetical protein BDD12DRAFT_312979 [Trichophaea hybrida]